VGKGGYLHTDSGSQKKKKRRLWGERQPERDEGDLGTKKKGHGGGEGGGLTRGAMVKGSSWENLSGDELETQKKKTEEEKKIEGKKRVREELEV